MTGRKTCNSRPVDILGTQLLLASGFRYCEKPTFDASDAVQSNIECRATKHHTVDGIQLRSGDFQLRIPENRFDSGIHEGCQGHWASDGVAIFRVGDQAEVASGKNNLVDRKRNGVAALQRIGWILGDEGTIGIA